MELHRRGRSFSDLAREFNLAATSISNWVRAADKRDGRSAQQPVSPVNQAEPDRIRELEKELVRKDEELEILGKRWPSSRVGRTSRGLRLHPR